MASSSSIELFFSVDRDRVALAEPLLFQHIPGGPGLSFRNAAGRFLSSAGSAIIEIPKAKAVMKAAGEWPSRFVGLYRRLAQWAHIDAVLSQHTNELADVTTSPILTILSDPDRFFSALVGARAAALLRDLEDGADADGEKVLSRVSNPQARALVNNKIPPFAPDDRAEKARFAGIARRTATRYRLFRADDYRAFASYCRDTHGLNDAGSRDGAKRELPIAGAARDRLTEVLGGRDPVWFDRMLYDRVSPQSRSAPVR